MVLPKRRESRSSPFLIINLTMTQPLSRTHSASASFAIACYQAIAPYLLLTTLLSFSTQFAWARRKDKDQYLNLATDIADHYIRSFTSDDDDERDESKAAKTTLQNLAHHTRPPKLDAATTRKVAFNAILAKSKNFDRVQQHMEAILNEYAWDDLKLFYGTPSAPGYHLLSRINRTKTALGEAALASLLATPTSNLEVLRERQHIIQTLLDNPRAVEELESTLQTYEDGEQSFLSLWTKTDPLVGKEYQKYMNRMFYYKDNDTDKSAGLLELTKRWWRDFCDIQFPFLWHLLYPIGLEIYRKVSATQFSAGEREKNWIFILPFYRSWYYWKKVREFLNNPVLNQIAKVYDAGRTAWNFAKSMLGYTVPNDAVASDVTLKNRCRRIFITGLPILELLSLYFYYRGYRAYREYSSVLSHLALRMADVQNFVRVATQVSETIAASPALEKVYGKHLTSIRQLLAQAEEDTELGRLIHCLQHLPLQNWNYFLNNAGKLLASYQLFVEHKDAFADAMYELGQLDAYLALATLMQEAQANDSNHAYTFVTFLDREQKNTPYIKIDQMWNPFLDPKQAVGNSIEMDGAPGGVRNIILTGPNASGKSTFLTSVTISLLLSQTVGIAPAQEAVITPFNKINSNIEKGDDIAAAESLFMVEVKRAQQNINIIKGLKPQEFSFTIFDELLFGTNPTEGAAAEYSIFEFLGAYSNSLSIVATHYPTVMRLEELAPDKGFVNYKVYSTRDSDGKIHYTYKIVPGKSNQAIAIDILEEQGFDVSILQRARQIIAYLDQYQVQPK